MTGIVLDNVSKYYKVGDQEFRVLNHVSITVHPGQFVAVIGPSGSGKSTFLSIAGAFLSLPKATSSSMASVCPI